jgi:hypothetical protein
VRTDDAAFAAGSSTTSSTTDSSRMLETASATTIMHAEWVEDPDAVPAPAPEPTPAPEPEPAPAPAPAPAPEPEPILADGTYELDFRTTTVKPTSTWSDARFVNLGYHTIEGLTGTLYAGINKATNMVEIGMLTATGWVLLEQAATALVKNTWYDVTVTTVDDLVTVAVNSVVYLTYQVE